MARSVNITQLAKVIRSKNAGPFQITFDIMFKDPASYEHVKGLGLIDEEFIAKLYRIPLERVISVVNYDAAYSIKATIAREVSSGTVGDTDVYGAQQHAPLLDIEVPCIDC